MSLKLNALVNLVTGRKIAKLMRLNVLLDGFKIGKAKSLN